MNFDRNTRYIYKVVYGQKNIYATYDVIKKVYYLRWDNEAGKIVDKQWDRESFAKELLKGSFKAQAGYKYNDNDFKDLVEVIAYEDNDGEIWIKTKADETTKNNLELLEYAKFYNFAEKE